MRLCRLRSMLLPAAHLARGRGVVHRWSNRILRGKTQAGHLLSMARGSLAAPLRLMWTGWRRASSMRCLAMLLSCAVWKRSRGCASIATPTPATIVCNGSACCAIRRASPSRTSRMPNAICWLCCAKAERRARASIAGTTTS